MIILKENQIVFSHKEERVNLVREVGCIYYESPTLSPTLKGLKKYDTVTLTIMIPEVKTLGKYTVIFSCPNHVTFRKVGSKEVLRVLCHKNSLDG